MKGLFDVASDKSLVALVGCGCSLATEEVAKITPFFNMTAVSTYNDYCIPLNLNIIVHVSADLLC